MKNLLLKIYDSNNDIVYITHRFNMGAIGQSINSGYGQAIVTLPIAFDFDIDTNFSHNNMVKIIAIDPINPRGKTIYTGFIGKRKPIISTNEERLDLFLYGYVSKLELDVLYSSTSTYVSYSSTAISTMFTNIIDAFNTNNSNIFSYDGDSITTIATTRTQGFDTKTYLKALEIVKELTPVDFYWYIDADNKIFLKQLSTTPDHYFTVGKDCAAIDYEDSIMELRNRLYFWNGGTLFKRFDDTTSQTDYGIQAEARKDQRFRPSNTSAENFANRFIDSRKDPTKQIRFRIFDDNIDSRGYDIESINVGDTAKFLNVGVGNSLPNNGVITNISYTPDFVDIDIENRERLVAREFADLSSRIANEQFNNTSTRTYTT